VVLLCGSVLLGARVLSSADDTVAVWGARTSLVKGQELTSADVVPVQVRFAEDAPADRYVAAADELPDGVFLTRDVGAGELVARAALGTSTEEALVEVPLSVEAAAIPSSVSVGSRVDVWVAPASGSRSGGGRPAEAVRVLADVAVVADGSRGVPEGLGGSAALPVVVGVPPSLQDDLPDVLARVGDGAVVLVRRPG
jgi:hypothetical protein